MSNPQNNPIPFYESGEKYYEFTNFYPCNITAALPSELDSEGRVVEGSVYLTGPLNWKSSEQIFHAMKFTQKGNVNKDLIDRISKIPSPRDAQNFAKIHDHVDYDTKNWWYNGWGKPGYNVRAMKWIVREKFSQITQMLGMHFWLKMLVVMISFEAMA